MSYPKAINYIVCFIISLDSRMSVRYLDHTVRGEGYLFNIKMGEQEVNLVYPEALIDDFNVAIEKYLGTGYYYRLENTIKFKIYIELGLKGLLSDYNISSELVNEKGLSKNNHSNYNLCIGKYSNDLFLSGLNKLSSFLSQMLTKYEVDQCDINDEKKSIDKLILYAHDKRTLSTEGASAESLSLLKAAAVCVVIDREQSRANASITRVKMELTKDIYRIVRIIKEPPFTDIALPLCIKDYYESLQTSLINEEEPMSSTLDSGRMDSFMLLLREMIEKKHASNKALMFYDFESRLPKDITADEMKVVIDTLVEKRYIIFEKVRNMPRFMAGPSFSEWISSKAQNITYNYSVHINAPVTDSNLAIHATDINQTMKNKNPDDIIKIMIDILNKDESISKEDRRDLIDDATTLGKELQKAKPRDGIVKSIMSTLGNVASIGSFVIKLNEHICKLFP